MLNFVKNQIQESIEVKQKLISISEHIVASGKLLAKVLQQDKKILLCGNGGSAADAQHIAAELMVRYKPQNNRKALPAISLSTDPSYITAAANDMGYENIFSRSIEALGNKGDALIGISTSGNSPNIINAVQTAKRKKMHIILMLNQDGGKLRDDGDIHLHVPSTVTAHVQESHILIGHILCSIIEKQLFGLD